MWYENEPFSLPYQNSDGFVRNYIPDFFVFRKKNKPQLLEIKPAFRMREESVQYKIKVAESYSNENGFDFLYMDEKFLKKEVPFSIEELKKLSFVEIIKH